MHRPNLGVVLADSRRARILLRHNGGGMEPIQALSREGEPRFIHDTRGRVFESATSARHALAPRMGRADEHRRAFAREIAEAVDAAVARGTVKCLVLAAPSRLLNEVRAQLGERSRKVIVGEIQKDLTRESEAELEHRLSELMI
ncbi:MAG: host attachment protein [Caulobacteraceae bacterium]|nr:host attachment protein [Caulobacteraceae bacterium]